MSISSAFIDGLLIGATSLAIASVSRAQDLPEPSHGCTKAAGYPISPYDSRNVLETGQTLIMPYSDAPNVLVSITIPSPETFLLPTLPKVRKSINFHVVSKPPVPDLTSSKPVKPRDIFVEGPTLSVDRSPRKPVQPERKREPIRGDEVAILPDNSAFRKAMPDARKFGSNGKLLPLFTGQNPPIRFNPRRHAVNR